MFKIVISKQALALVTAAGLASAGCATSAPSTQSQMDAELKTRANRIAELEASVKDQERALERKNSELSRLASSSARPDVAARAPSGGSLLPPSAKPGECYARLFVPAQYATQKETMLKREAAERLEIVPAKYEWVQERVLVKEASSKLVKVDAKYGTETEIIEVEPARTVWRTGKSSKSRIADAGMIASAKRLGAPLGSARPGQCFVEYATQPRFETVKEQVLKRETSSRVEIVPAKYEYVEERILVSDASQKLVQVPATYETVTEKVMVKPAHTMWKKGRGPVERIDHSTGEIMCLVEVPAQYRNVSKRVLKTAATTKSVDVPAKYKTVKVRKLVSPASERRVDIPAEYGSVSKRRQVAEGSSSWVADGGRGDGKPTGHRLCLANIPARTKTVTRRVVRTPASTRTVEIPAEYKTVKVKKLVSPAAERRIAIPAEYQEVTKRSLVQDGHLEWRSILCETNTTPQLISDIQRALKQNGHNPGPIDGVVGSQTLTAVRAFQKKKGLPSGNITLATLDALGVRH